MHFEFEVKKTNKVSSCRPASSYLTQSVGESPDGEGEHVECQDRKACVLAQEEGKDSYSLDGTQMGQA